jgi:cellulose synthase/poly-beta-1,6-N-acetylglucosamine synthase-like glycosyltransferase
VIDDTALAAVFWLGCAAALYAYVGFPALMLVAASRRHRQPRTGPETLTVSVIVPAYNEERSLEQKIRNVLGAEYPRSLLEVLVVSDASTDRTNEIARSFREDGVRLLVQETRSGKSAALNRAMRLAKGEVVVFTDANAMYPPDAIARLARHFRDPAIGLVSGYTRYLITGSGVAEATNLYTSLERIVKRGESRWGCCVGADGAIFAMRRSLYRPLRHDDINDFVLPLNVIEHGFRSVFDDGVFCSEHPGTTVESEFRRQSRITNRTLRALWRNARLLNPVRFGLVSVFLFSHKLVRFLVPGALGVAAMALALLVRPGIVPLAVACAMTAALAFAARLADGRVARGASRLGLKRVAGAAQLFLATNAAVLRGWWCFLSGRPDSVWQHDRSAG